MAQKRPPDHIAILKEHADRLIVQNDQLATEYRSTLTRVIELVAENAVLQTDLRETTEQRDLLAHIVRDVEWAGNIRDDDAVEGGVCPECRANECEGHRDICSLADALDLIDSFCKTCAGRRVVQSPEMRGALKPCPTCMTDEG